DRDHRAAAHGDLEASTDDRGRSRNAAAGGLAAADAGADSRSAAGCARPADRDRRAVRDDAAVGTGVHGLAPVGSARTRRGALADGPGLRLRRALAPAASAAAPFVDRSASGLRLWLRAAGAALSP